MFANIIKNIEDMMILEHKLRKRVMMSTLLKNIKAHFCLSKLVNNKNFIIFAPKILI
jgi:hypothetical protein